MKPEIFPTRILQLLVDLGNTPDEIAQALYELGFKGKLLNGADDPLSRCLSNCFGVAISIGKDYTREQHGRFAYYAVVNGERVLLPDAVRKFVVSFDNESYPFLLADRQDMQHLKFKGD